MQTAYSYNLHATDGDVKYGSYTNNILSYWMAEQRNCCVMTDLKRALETRWNLSLTVSDQDLALEKLSAQSTLHLFQFTVAIATLKL